MILGSGFAVLQSPVLDGLSFDPFPYVDYRKSSNGLEAAWRVALTVFYLGVGEGESVVVVIASALHETMPCP